MSGFTEMRIYKAVESTATEIFLRPSAQASSSPWYKAQSSAAVTGHTPPILSPKPMIHLPLSSLSKPPPVAIPAIPLTLPSVLSLTQPEFNQFHAMKFCVFVGFMDSTLRLSSVSCAFNRMISIGFVGLEKPCSKMRFFLQVHKLQVACAKIVCQGM